MELKIYDKQGLVKMTVSPDNSSQWNHEIGVENIVTVNFTTWEFLVMEVGWYIRVEGQKFSIKSEYRPKHINDSKYTYSLKFYGREHDTQDILFCRLNQGEYDLESVFAYDGTPFDFLQKVVDNMKRNSDGVDWKVGESISDVRKTINFNGLYCWDALNEIARTFGTEWWVDGEYLNLSKCERGESVSLGYGSGLKSGLTQNENTNAVKWFTRLIPVGSTKNIDKNKYGYSNLQLPGREKYIDINTQYGLKEYREESAFSEIYPHRVGTISSVRSEVRKNEETGDYTVYYVKDSSLPFNPDNYMIGGEVIHMTFNNGALAGKEFEVNWNNDTNEFEIINQYPDDNTQLPGGYLIPSIGNSYVLSNISMPESYNVAAESEFKQAVDAFLLEYSKDISIYSGNTDYIYINKHNVPLMLGQRVRLLSEQYFDGGERISRISRISRKLNNLADASVDCSDAISSSWKSSIDSSLNQLQYAATHEVVQALIKVLKSGDSEKPSEYNVLSALRSLNTFLRKDRDDSTPYGLSVGKHLDVGEKLTAKRGIQIGESFIPGILTGSGGFIDEQGNGELESLIIRRFLEVPELRYNRVEIKLGDKWNAPGAGVFERVVPDIDKNGNRLMSGTGYLKLEEGECGAIAVGDICMGIFHSFNAEENATEDSDDSRGNFQFSGFYTCYFTITEITGNDNKQFRYQMRPVSDRWKITYHPSEAMTFVCYGSFIREDRQTSVYTTRTYTRLLKDQNTWEISASNIAMQYGNMENMSIHGIDMTGYSMYLKNIYMTGTLKQVKPDGTPINVANDRGNYIPGEVYAYYDRVSYNGSLWLCVNESGTNTEPSTGESSWLLQVDHGIGISSKGQWSSEKTPYPMNSIVTFADKVWISNKETSEPPFGTYTDNERNRLTYLDGGYILVDQLIQSNDWDLLLDAPELTNGADGESLQVRYSSDRSSWHDAFIEGDVWMQQRVGDKATWSNPIRIVGEAGAAGSDGIYTDYQFSVNSSLTTAPVTGWQDTPPYVGTGQFLWMRMRVVDPNTSEQKTWHTARIGGEKGDEGQGFSIEGDWRTGLATPILGVVKMAGTCFAAKVATTNPPLYCWTDNDGNRLTFSDTEYIITGEMNSSEYDVFSDKGDKGDTGSKGDKGDKGEQGIQGCVVRDSEWAVGVEYRNDEGIGNGYIDVALVRSESTATGWVAYRCKKTHVSSSSITTTNTTYWEEFGSNVTAIFTSLIIAKNAKINFLQGNQLLIQKSNGKVTAGISGSEEGEKSRFWAGSETPDNAPFSVTEDGVTTSTKFRTGRSGLRLEAENGLIKVFGSIAKNIEFGVNDEGLAVMRYYDNDGALLYDLGPNGISSVRRDNDSWSLRRLTYLGADASEMFGSYWNTAKNPIYRTGNDYWQFFSGFIGNAYNDLENNRKIFKTKAKTDSSGKSNVITDGWYCDTLPQDVTQSDRVQYETLPNDVSDMNPFVDETLPIYSTEAYYIQSGRVISRQDVYYNLKDLVEDGDLK